MTTRTWVAIVFAMAFSWWTPAVFAADGFAYRDRALGCDVVVDHADGIPRKYREGAQVLTARQIAGARAASQSCRLSRAHRGLPASLVLTGDSGFAAGTVDVNVARNGGRYLTESELADLKKLCNPRVSAYLLAVLAALVAWIAVMVAAFREDHLGWAMLMLFLSAPMALVYLLTGLGKGHGRFKAVCALGMVSPLLVFLASVWRAFGSPTG